MHPRRRARMALRTRAVEGLATYSTDPPKDQQRGGGDPYALDEELPADGLGGHREPGERQEHEGIDEGSDRVGGGDGSGGGAAAQRSPHGEIGQLAEGERGGR